MKNWVKIMVEAIQVPKETSLKKEEDKILNKIDERLNNELSEIISDYLMALRLEEDPDNVLDELDLQLGNITFNVSFSEKRAEEILKTLEESKKRSLEGAEYLYG